MKALTVLRLYALIAVTLLVGWCVNLCQALTRTPVDWRDAAGLPLLGMIFLVLIMLERARSRLSANPESVIPISAGRYVVAGLAAAGLVAAVLLGLRVQH